MLSRLMKSIVTVAFVAAAPVSFAQSFSSGIPSGWSGDGNYGASPADGVVTLAPGGGTQYGWVSTEGGTGSSPFSFGGETNASWLRSNVFAASAGDVLEFKFNYVTSDGGTYVDYGWSRLLDSSLSQVALLFTARTNPSGDTIPGFGMPAPDATIAPPGAAVIGGAPTWSALGSSSGTCWSAGCGYTGWVTSTYTVASAGSYVLEFGVVNWSDSAYDTGMAFDGITIGGTPITPVPEPQTYAMLLAGLGLLGFAARRRKYARAS